MQSHHGRLRCLAAEVDVELGASILVGALLEQALAPPRLQLVEVLVGVEFHFEFLFHLAGLSLVRLYASSVRREGFCSGRYGDAGPRYRG